MSSIPSDPLWRGAAAAYTQPLNQTELLGARALVEHVYYMNSGPPGDPRLNDIIYRSSEHDHDVRRRVFRWDVTPYQAVFTNGFEARRKENTPDSTYFNLYDYISKGGWPLDTTRPATHAFISTTLDTGWRPNPYLQPSGESMPAYRYEIFAPGGIWVYQTLVNHRNRNTYPHQVCFIAAIAPQYIRSAQLYEITHHSGRFQSFKRVDDRLLINVNFAPDTSAYLKLRLPVVEYMDKTSGRKKLKKVKYYPIPKPKIENHDDEIEKSQQLSDDIINWYDNGIEDIKSYINAAFRAYSTNEAYLFMKNEYVLVNYAPGSTDDKIINGPLLICYGFQSLVGTTFGEDGIDCAFNTDGTEAFIFSGNLCALIDYAPGTTDDKILRGPTKIATMFPFFKGTVFENGIDSAFRSTTKNEAYLFKQKMYALINYSDVRNIAIRPIKEGFHGLRGTIFETGIEAAFASHRTNEAYIFKGNQFALINFAPATTDDRIIGGVKTIVDHWPSLRSILPRNNHGLDQHNHIEHI